MLLPSIHFVHRIAMLHLLTGPLLFSRQTSGANRALRLKSAPETAATMLAGRRAVHAPVLFNEWEYVSGGALKPGEDPYKRNKFNQKISDALSSDRKIEDTRSPA